MMMGFCSIMTANQTKRMLETIGKEPMSKIKDNCICLKEIYLADNSPFG